MQKKVNLSDMTHLFDHVLNDFSKIEYLTELAFDSFLMKKKCNYECDYGLLFLINQNFILRIVAKVSKIMQSTFLTMISMNVLLYT